MSSTHDIADEIEDLGRYVPLDKLELMVDDGRSEMMLHPCQTVWTVGQLDNGDVIIGGSDGRVRIWTRDEERYAARDVREVSPIICSESLRPS